MVREKSSERQGRRKQDWGPLHAPVSAHCMLIVTASRSTIHTVKELLQATANGPWNVTQCSTRSSAWFAFTHTYKCTQSQQLMRWGAENLWEHGNEKPRSAKVSGLCHIFPLVGTFAIITLYLLIYYLSCKNDKN